MSFSDLTAGDPPIYKNIEKYSFPPEGLQRQSYPHARDPKLKLKRS